MRLLSNEILEVAIDRYYTENLSENFCAEFTLKRTFEKKFQYSCFPVNFGKGFITTFLQNISG